MVDKVSFVVPSGNFGNALAGYYAKKLGLPIDKFVIATNHNDILHRCVPCFCSLSHRTSFDRLIADGDYSRVESKPSVAPAMDITVPSNFERCGSNIALTLFLRAVLQVLIQSQWELRQDPQQVDGQRHRGRKTPTVR